MGFLQSSRHGTLGNIFLILIEYWTFPYIFFAVTLAIIVQPFFPAVGIIGISFTPIELMLCFFAVTYPFLTVVILFETVYLRSVGKAYKLFVHDLGSLLITKGDRN